MNSVLTAHEAPQFGSPPDDNVGSFKCIPNTKGAENKRAADNMRFINELGAKSSWLDPVKNTSESGIFTLPMCYWAITGWGRWSSREERQFAPLAEGAC